MTSGHFIYIPAILAVGFVLGFVFGGRAARDAFDMEKRREEERARVKAEREARKAARAKESEQQDSK